MSGTQSALEDSPPAAWGLQTDPLAAITLAASRGIWYRGPQRTALSLAATLSSLHDRAARQSPLGLEHVLDNQSLAPGTLVLVTVGQSNLSGDLRFTAQRPPVAPGLKLLGVHPGPTRYLQPKATATVQVTATPQPTPTLGTPANAVSIRGVSPTPPPTDPATWTEATMPGGNARMFRITGYTWTGGRTATGTLPRYGEIAVDPHVIPLGATVYVQGLGTFHAEDTGSAIVGDHIDVFVNSDAEAYAITGWRLVSWTNS
jgi:3D (Asp-Asp-Asp) domain-containing protein